MTETQVAVAIVTSHLGVLVGKRADGTPPWTFPGGKTEPGESHAKAAVREVWEETGVEVTAGEVIGQRVHPQTGVTVVYVAAVPARGTEAHPVAGQGLAEIRWVSLAEAVDRMPGMFGPVRHHLEQVLSRRSKSNSAGPGAPTD